MRRHLQRLTIGFDRRSQRRTQRSWWLIAFGPAIRSHMVLTYVKSAFFTLLFPALCIAIVMRHSVAPNRASQPSSSAAALTKLLEKKKEYEGVAALERASSLYLERIEALGQDCETMATAGEGIPLTALQVRPIISDLNCSSPWPSPCTMAQNVPNTQSIS